MKRLWNRILAAELACACLLAGCKAQSDVVQETTKQEVEGVTYSDFVVDLEGVSTLNQLDDRVEEHLEKCISSLTMRWEDLETHVDSYEAYCAQVEEIAQFYVVVGEETEQMCFMLEGYSAAYGHMILDSELSVEDMYDEVDHIHDEIYEDACDRLHDDIYEDLLEDMKDHFEEILEEGRDTEESEAWSDVTSDAQDQWETTETKVYEAIYDLESDIYGYYSDLSSELYCEDVDRANKVCARFEKKIEENRNRSSELVFDPDAVFDTTIKEASSPEELEIVIQDSVMQCIQALVNEWLSLSKKTDTYESYVEHQEEVEAFHVRVVDATQEIMDMIRKYGASYAESIVNTGRSSEDLYKDMWDLKYVVYDDACEMVKREIYDGLLGAIKAQYYDGVIREAKKEIGYSAWAQQRSSAYGSWIDARSDVYGAWFDGRSDLYGFLLGVRSSLYFQDMEAVQAEIDEFIEGDKEETGVSNEARSSDESVDEGEGSGIRDEFKEAMDEYEAFYDSYCAFLKKFQEDPTDADLITEYQQLLVQMEEMNDSFDAWQNEDLNDAEMQYYIEVAVRIQQKLLDLM